MKLYFAYIRVSTVKQGEKGSSLQEQHDAICNLARRERLTIAAWYEEKETAAKTGRVHFDRMVAALKRGEAGGVIFHKIDRSARNLKDWSAVQDLVEMGIDVRFSQESINLASNEGRLTGDFLAVISAHYIRNLRDEVRKGIHGRLKQGLFPFRAFVGYLDRGGGKPKIPDPARAPFIRLAFEEYASGRHSVRSLAEMLHYRGLRNARGKKIGANRIAAVLRNPFYMGVIRLKRSATVYAGVHEPLVSPSLFDQVQRVMDGKFARKTVRNSFTFSRLIRCKHCNYSLVGDLKKGHVYYRCHTQSCPTLSLREEHIHAAVRAELKFLDLPPECDALIQRQTANLRLRRQEDRNEQLTSIALQIGATDSRLTRLTDVYLDGGIDRGTFEQRKFSLLKEQKELEAIRTRLRTEPSALFNDVEKHLELLSSLVLSYEKANSTEKRELLKSITSNITAEGKDLEFKLKNPFEEVKKLNSVRTGGPVRNRPRTSHTQKLFDLLAKYCQLSPKERQDNEAPLGTQK